MAYQERKLVDSLFLAVKDEVNNVMIYPQVLRDKVSTFDIGTGFLLNNERLNLGIIGKHLMQPDMSFTGIKEQMLMRLSLITDYTFGKLDEKKAWKFAPGLKVNYVNSETDVTITAAAVYHKFRFGFAYRNDANDTRNNAAMMQLSYNGLIFKFRYAYDFYTQKINGSASGGSHEATVLLNLFNKKKKDDFIANPVFAF